MLVGNKAEQLNLRSVRTEDAKAFAERENIKLFMETSALESLNVENAFTQLLTQIYHMKSKKAVDIKNSQMVEPNGQMINVGGEHVGITRIPKETEFFMASRIYSQDNGLITQPPRLSSDDNFCIWKKRMISYLNFFDSRLLATIKDGRNIPLNEGSKWSDENKQKVGLEYMAMHILSVSLPDDIYRFVMNCESAKEMWDNLILLFEGTDETREWNRSLLIQQYELFTYTPGESLTQTYLRFKYLINDLRQHRKTFDNDEILIKFLRSLPVAWNAMSINIRHTNNLKTMSLECLYGLLLTHELSMKEEVSVKDEGYYKAKYQKLKAKMKKSCVAKEVNLAETSSDDEDA